MDGDRLKEILARDFPSRAFDLYFWRMYDSMVEKIFYSWLLPKNHRGDTPIITELQMKGQHHQ